MSRYNNLPFERRGTYFGGDSALISASEVAGLEGATYIANSHEGVGYVKLRVLRNKGAHYTLSATNRYRGFAYGDTANWHGRKVRGLVAGLGALGIALDDAYASNGTGYVIKQNDLFYGVEEGTVRLRFSSAGTAGITITVTNLVCFTTNGKVQVCAAGSRPIGKPDKNVAGTGATNKTELVHMGSLFAEIR